MASIKVKYRPSTIADHEGAIYYQIIHERKVRRIITNYHVMPHEWSESRSMVTATPGSDRMALIVSIHTRIRMDLERLTRINARMESAGLAYTADDLIDEYRRCTREYTLFAFMERLIVNFRHNGKIRTSETYTAALHSFRKFLASPDYNDPYVKPEEIMLDNVTPELMEAYEAWHKRRGNSPNTISFYTRILRAVYHRAVADGITENRYPFRHVYTGVYKTAKRAIPLAYIKKIKEINLSDNPSWALARDMFLMSFYLRGMSFIDMAFLKKTDLKNGYVIYRRRKTGQQLIIAWTREMQEIIDNYPANPTQYLLPIIKTNGINERCAYRNVGYNINRNLKKIAALEGISVPLTLYVARHSWASAAKAKGVPLSIISEGMGHDSEATTQIYLASLDTSAVDNANSLILSSL